MLDQLDFKACCDKTDKSKDMLPKDYPELLIVTQSIQQLLIELHIFIARYS